MTTTSPSGWPHCGYDSSTGDPVGCRGITIPGSANCLAHAAPAERTAYLGSLAPGGELNLCGVTISSSLLDDVLAQFTEPGTGHLRIGAARFDSATFTGDVWFDSATFTGDAWFNSATFTGQAIFDSATFNGEASFDSATFNGDAVFNSATFSGDALFESATFARDAWFTPVTFTGKAWFTHGNFMANADFSSANFTGAAWFLTTAFSQDAHFGSATFTGNVVFEWAAFAGEAEFRSASFERAAFLGPLRGDRVDLSEATFGSPIRVEIDAKSLVCRRTHWLDTARVWVRYAEVDLSDAVFDHPLTIATRRRPPATAAGAFADADPQAQVTSLQGVDAAHLVLTDMDLSRCLFSGTVHLDQVRLEGQYRLATAPAGLRRRGAWPVRWTPRRTLAEEHHWRASRQVGADGWAPAPQGREVLTPAALAPVYRQLRKSFEDGKHEPGAADFYYGEMEMRRHADDIPRGERRLLTLYWALSGYGLRASRALGWLLAAMTLTVLLMMLWGLPQGDTPTRSTGDLTGRHVVLTTKNADPANPTGPLHRRLTSGRFEKSLRVVVNSVVFRSSGQGLTTTGTYTEMASRLTEPVLLGLAALAVRSRIKR